MVKAVVMLNERLEMQNQKHTGIWLFAKGKKPINVAIELDLSSAEVHEMRQEFWALNDGLSPDIITGL